MTTNNSLPTAEQLEAEVIAARNARFTKSARALIATLRSGDRLISKDNAEKAAPKKVRPATKTGKRVRRDAAITVAEDIIDLEAALDKEDFDEARPIFYRLNRLTKGN